MKPWISWLRIGVFELRTLDAEREALGIFACFVRFDGGAMVPVVQCIMVGL